jgi:hypothetical protein
MNVRFIWCCTVPAALLYILKFEEFEGFIREKKLPNYTTIYLVGLWCIDDSLRANGRRGRKQRGPLYYLIL